MCGLLSAFARCFSGQKGCWHDAWGVAGVGVCVVRMVLCVLLQWADGLLAQCFRCQWSRQVQCWHGALCAVPEGRWVVGTVFGASAGVLMVGPTPQGPQSNQCPRRHPAGASSRRGSFSFAPGGLASAAGVRRSGGSRSSAELLAELRGVQVCARGSVHGVVWRPAWVVVGSISAAGREGW